MVIGNLIADTKEFGMGDFAQFLYGKKPSFAVVTDTDGDSLVLRHFEDGFPFEISRGLNDVMKATKDEALAHFHKISGKFEKEFEAGGLTGALSSRRQHYLDGIIAQLEKPGQDSYYAAKINPADPMTGTYVLMGIYSGQGPSEHLEGMVAVPRLSEGTVSRIMRDVHPKGFGRIPSDVYNTPATSHGSLVAYWTYEVPEKALGLVENPKKLELRLD